MKKRGAVITATIFLISVATFFILLNRLGTENIVDIFYRVELWHIASIIGIMGVYLFLFTLRWQRVLKLDGLRTSIKDLYIYRLAGYAVSYLTPAADFGGEPMMAHLITKEYKEISFTKSLSSVVANRIVDVFVRLTFIAISFAYVLFFFVLPENTTILFYVIFGSIILLLFTLCVTVLKKKGPLLRISKATGLYKLNIIKKRESKIKEFDSLLDKFFHHNPKELFINFVLSILATFSIILIFWFLALFLDLDINFMEAMVASSIHALTISMIPVPGSIGFGEAGETAWFGIMGIGAASGFSYYIIFRTRDIFYSLVGLICLFYKGMGKEVMDIIKSTFTNGSDKKTVPGDKK